MGSVRRWSLGVAAIAAAALGGAGLPQAHADGIDDLLLQAEGNINNAATLTAGINPAELSAQKIADQVAGLQGQAGLISQIQTQQDGLSETLQSSSQLLSADNQLNAASGDLLTAVTGYVNAADAGDYASGASFSGELTGYFDRLDVLYAELFQYLPATLNAEFTTLGLEYPHIEPLPLPTDLASSAASVTTLAAADSAPVGLLSDATTNYTDANQLLNEIPSGEFASVSGAILHQGTYINDIASLGASETALSSYANGAFADLLNPVFGSVNQGWDQASEAALNADQALETAVAGGSATDTSAALVGLIEPTYLALGPDLDSNLIDLGAHLLTGIDPISAGADTAAALDPSFLTDVLTSIGF